PYSCLSPPHANRKSIRQPHLSLKIKLFALAISGFRLKGRLENSMRSPMWLVSKLDTRRLSAEKASSRLAKVRCALGSQLLSRVDTIRLAIPFTPAPSD